MGLSEHVVEEIRALPGRFPHVRSAVMPALDIAQEQLGHLTPEAMTEVADLLELDPGYVEGVATFYPLFHLRPTGRHHFYVCTNLSCALRGANEICDHVRSRVGVQEKEVSEDGLFSFEEVECLGGCEYAPMMRYAHRFHYDLTLEKVDAVIDAARNSASPLVGEGRGEGSTPSPSTGEGRGEGSTPSPLAGEGRGEGESDNG